MSCVADRSVEDIAERYRRKLAGRLRGSPTTTDGFGGFVIRAPARKTVTAESSVTPELEKVARNISAEPVGTCAAPEGYEGPDLVSEGTREEHPTGRVQTIAERSLALNEFAEHDTRASADGPSSTPEDLPQGTPMHSGVCRPRQNSRSPPVAGMTVSQAEVQPAESSPGQQLSDADETGAGSQYPAEVVAAVAPVVVLSSHPEDRGDPLVFLSSSTRRSRCAVANDQEGNEVLPIDGGCFERSADASGEMKARKSKDRVDASAPGKADGRLLYEDINTRSRTSKVTEKSKNQDFACGTLKQYAAVRDCPAGAWTSETDPGMRTSASDADDCLIHPGRSSGNFQPMGSTGGVGEDVYREPPIAGCTNLENSRQIPARSETMKVQKQSGVAEIKRIAGSSPSLSRSGAGTKPEKGNPIAFRGDAQLVNSLEECEVAAITTSGPDASRSPEVERLEVQKTATKRKTSKKRPAARKTVPESASDVGRGKPPRRAGKGCRRNRENKADLEATPGLPLLRRGMVARKAGSVAIGPGPGTPAAAVLTGFMRERPLNDGTEHPPPAVQIGEVTSAVDHERSRRYPERKRRPPREYWILDETRRRA